VSAILEPDLMCATADAAVLNAASARPFRAVPVRFVIGAAIGADYPARTRSSKTTWPLSEPGSAVDQSWPRSPSTRVTNLAWCDPGQ
jgi:hypothetical protein